MRRCAANQPIQSKTPRQTAAVFFVKEGDFMYKIVFFCIPAHGHTNPTLGVVKELVSRGHQVWYYSYDLFRDKIQATGATYVSCDPYDAELRLSPHDAARLGQDLVLSTQVLTDTALALDSTVCAHMKQLQPDCIVADSMAVWGKAVAMKLGIPFVSSTTTFAFNRHSAKIMKQSAVELVRMLLAMPKIQKNIHRLQQAGYPVNSLLDILQNDDNTHTVVYTSPEFQPCADTFSDKYVFVGPSLRPATTDVRKIRDTLVYISMGTVNNAMLPLYRELISQLSGTDYQVILSVGDRVSPADLGPLPPQISVFPQVDQIAVLQKADVFLSHGGMNSVSESLYYGVPLVLLPQTKEQQGVSEQVCRLGAGCKPRNAKGPSLLAAIQTVLADPGYREAAGRISESFRRCPGAVGAADKIQAVCQSRLP